VAGFVVASVYAVAVLKGRVDRYHYLGFVIRSRSRPRATPLPIFIGDVVAREVLYNEPAQFAAIETIDATHAHARRRRSPAR
jgi:cytochrome d ubiquinol oxidase subunit I